MTRRLSSSYESGSSRQARTRSNNSGMSSGLRLRLRRTGGMTMAVKAGVTVAMN